MPEAIRLLDAEPPSREPPHSEESEEHVLACCLIEDSDTLSRCLNEGVTPATFFQPRNQTIFSALIDMAAAGATPTVEALVIELNNRRVFHACGGYPYLMQLTGKIPTTAHAGYFIEKLIEKKMLRDVIWACTRAVEGAYGFTNGMEDFMASIERDLMSVGRNRGTGIRKWDDAVADAKKRMDEMLASKDGSIQGEVSWGFRDMDRMFEPMQPGQLVTLAARPSIGKSSLMRQIVLHSALNRIPSFVASLEVKDYNIVRSMAQTRSGVSYNAVKRYRAQGEIERFRVALEEMRGLPIHTLDDFSASSDKICAQARLIKSRCPLGLVVVDHLQEVPDARASARVNATEAIGEVCKRLKALAGELNLPVLMLSQLNRAAENENRRPRLHDLRASGDIEQSSDKVVFLHRPTQMPPMDGKAATTQSPTSDVREQPHFYIEACQAKGRDDGTGEVGLMFKRDIATFRSIQL